jgi:CxxC motif-containing protein (DUF1111 family)
LQFIARQFITRVQSLRWLYGALFGLALLLVVGLSHLWSQTGRWDPPQAGGTTTLYSRSSQSFQLPAPGLTPAEARQHASGDVSFDAIFVTAPAPLNPGLGPKFNNQSCAACHIKNGRGMPEMGQSLVRVSLPSGAGQAIDPHQGVVPVPGIGGQIRDRAVQGAPPDAQVQLDWKLSDHRYPDGQPYQLRQPQLKVSAAPGQPLPQGLQTSLRAAPPVFGVGLLEAIPEQEIQRLADPGDRDGDGISGKANQVWDPVQKAMTLGRFGLKANTSTLLVQTAAAYVNDIGITNPIFPQEAGSSAPAAAPEIDQTTLEQTTFYVATLAVPGRTQMNEAMVQQGEQRFAQANCAACHIATLKTGPSKIPVLADQTIHPYSDLLLHDMGAGLADGRPDFAADGQEWRTTPLWGLGLTQTVLPYSGYLHDGRARTIEEAILWHGGEAEGAKQKFMAMNQGDRQALLKFLNSL